MLCWAYSALLWWIWVQNTLGTLQHKEIKALHNRRATLPTVRGPLWGFWQSDLIEPRITWCRYLLGWLTLIQRRRRFPVQDSSAQWLLEEKMHSAFFCSWNLDLSLCPLFSRPSKWLQYWGGASKCLKDCSDGMWPLHHCTMTKWWTTIAENYRTRKLLGPKIIETDNGCPQTLQLHPVVMKEERW